jgi:hypothetical protein
MGDNRNTLTMWLGGVLLALLLIVISTRAGGGFNNAALSQRFIPHPTDPNAPTSESFQLPQVNLPSLPPALQQQITSLRDRLIGGQAVPALTPVASGPRARVEVTQIKRSGDHVQISGNITNSTSAALTVPPGAFTFRDSRGITYATTTSGGTTLQANQSTSFDLGVPVDAAHGLTLILTLPPDPPLQQTLLVEPQS